MNRPALILISAAGLLIFSAARASRSSNGEFDLFSVGDTWFGTADNTDNTDNTGTDIMTTITNAATSLLGLWTPPAKYAQYIATAEAANGLPPNMLARLLYQECRYREDIITGRTTSPVGAQGIAQFMPATAREMGINPLDPAQAIPAAARYIASLYRQTGTWTKALAAYNWGIGNVQRKGLSRAPAETRNYYTQILADVNSANGSNVA